MRAVEIIPDRSKAISDIDRKGLLPEEVRLQISLSGICGSDLHILQGDYNPVGLVPCHEFSARISEDELAVSDTRGVGTQVTVLPIDACDECVRCLTGEGTCGPGLRGRPGLGRQGGFDKSVVVPASMLFELPDSVIDECGAIKEPLAVAVRTVSRSGAELNQGDFFLGDGPSGFITAVAWQARGFKSIAVVDPNEARLKRVAALGLSTSTADDAKAAPAALGGPPAVVIGCSGQASGAHLAINMLPPHGLLTEVAVTTDLIPTNFSSIATKQLTIRGSIASSRDNFREALSHIAEGRVPLDKIETSVATPDEGWSAMHGLASGQSDHVKVLLRPRGALA